MPSELSEVSKVSGGQGLEAVWPWAAVHRTLTRGLSWASLFWFSCFFACVEGDETPADGLALRGDWCSSYCAILEQCGGAFDPSCSDGCRSWSTAYMRRTVAESIEAEAACFRASTACAGGMDEVFTECFEQASLAAPPSAASDHFCARLSQTFFECSWFPSPDSCSLVNARYTAPALAAGERCSDAACDELQQCMEASVWRYGQP